MEEHLHSMLKALGLIPSTTSNKTKKNELVQVPKS
jgi:hypothetical protein